MRQSLECMLIQFLLGLLKSRANLSNNPATVIAQIVSALKTMAQNLQLGDQVLHILNSDPIWAEFKDQNHDLFIMDTQKRGMIAGELKASTLLIQSFTSNLSSNIRTFQLCRWIFDASSQQEDRSHHVTAASRSRRLHRLSNGRTLKHQKCRFQLRSVVVKRLLVLYLVINAIKLRNFLFCVSWCEAQKMFFEFTQHTRKVILNNSKN